MVTNDKNTMVAKSPEHIALETAVITTKHLIATLHNIQTHLPLIRTWIGVKLAPASFHLLWRLCVRILTVVTAIAVGSRTIAAMSRRQGTSRRFRPHSQLFSPPPRPPPPPLSLTGRTKLSGVPSLSTHIPQRHYTGHLQTVMPSHEFEPSPYGTAVSVTNHDIRFEPSSFSRFI
ncbi:hypothetical protein TNCV_2820901 [Trichonephila clavipes]|nr:hypothetical protein TNCV_2820901 [Trichonephila clavipes]